MGVPLLDLTNQYFELKEESDALWFDTMENSAYIGGARVANLERELAEYVGVKHCISCANGTDALFLIFEALGLKRGDEVITTPWTFFATIEAIVHLGGVPVMVDIDPRTYNIDPKKVREAITDKTRFIMPVHIYGQCVDMDEINAIALEHNLIVVEDACQAMGASYKGKMAGALSRAAAFSFYPTKNLGCAGDGGCITTDDDELAARCRLFATHGSAKVYHHDIFGTNSRLDSIQAGLLSLRLTKLDEWNQQRIDAAAYYDEKLADIAELTTPFVEEFNKSIYHLYILKTEKAVELMNFLRERGLGASLYYPMSLHEQECFKILDGFEAPNLPVAESCASKTVAIPCYPGLTRAQQDEVIAAMREFFGA